MGFSLKSFLGGKGASAFDLTPGGILDDLTGRRNMREQNDWNLQMWNLQNAYNTPAAQMQRYKEAGLNPNLILGQTNTAGPVHASASAEGLGGALGKVSSAFSAIMGMKQAVAQIKNLKQQNDNLKSQDSLLNAQESFTRAQKDRYEYETNWLREHNTTSFEDPRVRSVKGSLGESSKGFADFVGRKVGEVQGYFTPSGDVVMRPNNFASKEEFNREFDRMLRQGRRVFIEY